MIDPDNIRELNIGLLILLNSNVMSQVESLSKCIHKCQKKTREKFQKSHFFVRISCKIFCGFKLNFHSNELLRVITDKVGFFDNQKVSSGGL